MSSQVGLFKQASPVASPLESAPKTSTRKSTQESSPSVFAEKLQQRNSVEPKAKPAPQKTKHEPTRPSDSSEETAEPSVIPSQLESQEQESSTDEVEGEATTGETVELSFSHPPQALPQFEPKRSIELRDQISSSTQSDAGESVLKAPAGFVAQFTAKPSQSDDLPEQAVSVETTEVLVSTDSLNTSREVAQSGIVSQDVNLSESTDTDTQLSEFESEISEGFESNSRKIDGGNGVDEAKSVVQSQSWQPNSSQPDGSRANGQQSVTATAPEVSSADDIASAKTFNEPVVREVETARSDAKPVEAPAASSEPTTPAVTGPTANASGEVAKTQPESGDTAQRLQSLVDRVAEAVESAGRQQSTRPLRIRLDPPELGVLSIEVQTQGGQVSARLQVESSSAQRLLLDHLPQLQEALTHQTGGATQVEVVRSESANSDSQQHSYSQEQSTSQQHQQQQQRRATSIAGNLNDGAETSGDSPEDKSSPQRSSRSDALVGIDIEV